MLLPLRGPGKFKNISRSISCLLIFFGVLKLFQSKRQRDFSLFVLVILSWFFVLVSFGFSFAPSFFVACTAPLCVSFFFVFKLHDFLCKTKNQQKDFLSFIALYLELMKISEYFFSLLILQKFLASVHSNTCTALLLFMLFKFCK